MPWPLFTWPALPGTLFQPPWKPADPSISNLSLVPVPSSHLYQMPYSSCVPGLPLPQQSNMLSPFSVRLNAFSAGCRKNWYLLQEGWKTWIGKERSGYIFNQVLFSQKIKGNSRPSLQGTFWKDPKMGLVSSLGMPLETFPAWSSVFRVPPLASPNPPPSSCCGIQLCPLEAEWSRTSAIAMPLSTLGFLPCPLKTRAASMYTQLPAVHGFQLWLRKEVFTYNYIKDIYVWSVGLCFSRPYL